MSDAPPPASGMPTWAKVLLGVAGACVLCCAGVALLAWGTIREFLDIAALPPAERQAALSDKLRSVVADQVAVTDAFLEDLDAERTEAAWARTSPTFRSTADAAGLEKIRRKIAAVMGARQSALLQSAYTRSNVTFGSGPSVDTCDIVYGATYANGPATITFALERGASGWTVRLFRVDSPRFLDAISESSPEDSPK